MVNKLFIGIVIWLISFSGFSQSLISYITVNPDNVYIGQPVQLKVSVYSSTWFTKGIDLGNIQVDGALTVYFRSVSNSRDFNGKKYAGVDFYYNLFPTKDGTITVPAIDINVESPKEGGYKGIKHSIKTKPKSIEVKGVPLGYDPNNWLVATSLNVTEKWLTSIQNVKVGDVIQRSISRAAGGTLSEFIPKTVWDSVVGVSIYPQRPSINTNKSKTGVSSSRNETVSYLFEKEGEITIPAIEYLYWNSGNKKFYRKQIDSITLTVKPNADLAMLATIKKSLQKEKEGATIEETEAPFLIFGMTAKEFAKNVIFLIIGSFLFITLFKILRRKYKNYKIKRLQSEGYTFKNVIRAIEKKDFLTFLNVVNTWLRKVNYKKESLNEFVSEYGSEELKTVLSTMNDSYFNQQKSIHTNSFKVLIKSLKNARKSFITQQAKINKGKTTKNWLNPLSID